MKIHRFIGTFDLKQDRIAVHDPELVHQVRTVLKLATGERIVLANGIGDEATTVIKEIDASAVTVEVESRRKNTGESGARVTLYCAILKRENFELAAQKATEVGVAEIVPLITERTVKLGFKADRLKKILIEASEQSGRGTVPTLNDPMKLVSALGAAAGNDENYFFDKDGASLERPAKKRVGIFIGPEGGWTDAELALAKEYGCKTVSLGAMTLRGETAAIVATYLATHP
jgi:16S rRNA (uracil1498-N3)-methyltransferase